MSVATSLITQLFKGIQLWHLLTAIAGESWLMACQERTNDWIQRTLCGSLSIESTYGPDISLPCVICPVHRWGIQSLDRW